MEKPCFLDSSTQNHAEASRNFVKHSVLDPKCARLDQRSPFGYPADRVSPEDYPLFYRVSKQGDVCPDLFSRKIVLDTQIRFLCFMMCFLSNPILNDAEFNTHIAKRTHMGLNHA